MKRSSQSFEVYVPGVGCQGLRARSGMPLAAFSEALTMCGRSLWSKGGRLEIRPRRVDPPDAAPV